MSRHLVNFATAAALDERTWCAADVPFIALVLRASWSKSGPQRPGRPPRPFLRRATRGPAARRPPAYPRPRVADNSQNGRTPRLGEDQE